ncbi:MAG: aminopeptidase P family N-terminal domain-containing protein, partial [Actinomycetota bacterium]|nr:aminopeptidase P family N-terminal domain-containing protein [Actinomycetota bacterium]
MTPVLDAAHELEKARGRAPAPPPEEREDRLRRARAALAANELDGLVAYGTAGGNSDPIRYLAGYVHVFPTASSLLLLPLERDPILLVDQPWHLEEAHRMSWIDDVRSYPPPARRWLAEELRSTVREALETAGLERGRIGLFEGETPAVYRDALAASGSDTQLVEAAPVWHELVATPSDYDAESIRATAAVADEGL